LREARHDPRGLKPVIPSKTEDRQQLIAFAKAIGARPVRVNGVQKCSS
jgi:hypothetical protein